MGRISEYVPDMSSITNFFSGSMLLWIVGGLVVAVVAWWTMRTFWKGSKAPVSAVASAQGFEDLSGNVKKEGFFGGVAVGAGMPDCLRTSAEAAQLYSMFADRQMSTEEGSPDLAELRLLLSKLSCFKKDLTGVAGVVEATRYQAYATSMDIEPIAETTARCFAKTIPARDLDISLDKWSKRGQVLINRLCTSANLSEKESQDADKLFDYVIRDVSDIAKSVCLSGQPMVGGSPTPRQPGGYEAPALQELGPYEGYY